MKLNELADQLGLSQTTVSRALNGYPEVNAETRQRVMDAAKQWGYRPNASARRLATGRVGAIGIVLPDENSQLFGPHTSEYLSGVAGRLVRDEVDILVTPLEKGDEIPAYRRLIASKRVDALIVGCPALVDARVQMLCDIKFPFVLHGRTSINAPHAWLDIDNQGGFHQATTHLLDLGHRRIGMIDGPAGRTFSEHREAGFRQALLARGLQPDPRLIAHDRFADDTGFHHARNFLQNPEPPTAIIAGSMMTALGVQRAIRAAGLSVGGDISLIAHDDVFPFLSAENLVPSLTTMQSSIRAAGERIADLVLQVLSGAPVETIHELWPVELIVRQSTGPAPKR